MIFCPSRNNDISIFLSLHITMVLLDHVIQSLTGRQNSSKAGLTNCVYCVNTCSSSRPRSCISLNTVTMTTVVNTHTRVSTSSGQPCITVGIYKQFHLQHLPHFITIQHENSLKQHYICRVEGTMLR